MNKRDKYCQEQFIMAAHNCSLEEAKKKEIMPGCLVATDTETPEAILWCEYSELKSYWKIRTDRTAYGYLWRYQQNNNDNEISILGMPPTLDRVLNALGGNCYRIIPERGIIDLYVTLDPCDLKFQKITWKLLNEDGTSATFFDQNEETKEAIAKILGFEA